MANRYATSAEVVGATGIAPNLGVLDAALVTAWLTTAQAYIGLEAWGDKASTGHALLTAHFLALTPEALAAGVGGLGGVLSAEANGPASRSFAVPSYDAGDAAFAGTMYGQQFVELRRAIMGAMVGRDSHRGVASSAWWGSSGRVLAWSR